MVPQNTYPCGPAEVVPQKSSCSSLTRQSVNESRENPRSGERGYLGIRPSLLPDFRPGRTIEALLESCSVSSACSVSNVHDIAEKLGHGTHGGHGTSGIPSCSSPFSKVRKVIAAPLPLFCRSTEDRHRTNCRDCPLSLRERTPFRGAKGDNHSCSTHWAPAIQACTVAMPAVFILLICDSPPCAT